MITQTSLRHLVPAVVGAGLLSVISGCGDDDSSNIFLPPQTPPTVNNFFTSQEAVAGTFTFVSQSVTVPTGIPNASDAFELAYTAPSGDIFRDEFSPAQVGCVVGAVTCSSTFEPQVPPDLPILPASYLVTFSVSDRNGRIAAASQTVFITLN